MSISGSKEHDCVVGFDYIGELRNQYIPRKDRTHRRDLSKTIYDCDGVTTGTPTEGHGTHTSRRSYETSLGSGIAEAHITILDGYVNTFS